MSRAGITFEEVKNTIAELQGRQKNPTVDNIREVLGTGSKSTIARFLREWKAQQDAGNANGTRLPSDLLSMVDGLWDTLQSKADVQIDQYRLEFENKNTQIQRQLVEAKQQEATLSQTIHSLEEALHQKTEESQRLTATLTTETQEKIRIAERATALDARCHEHHAENQRLHQLLKNVQASLEHYQAATQQLRHEQSLILEKQQNEYEQRLSMLSAQAHTALNEKVACQAQYEQLAKAQEHLLAEHQMLKQDSIERQSEYKFLKIAHEKMQQQYESLSEQNKLDQAELANQQHTVISLELKLKSKDEAMVLLQETLLKANDKIDLFRNENQFLSQEKASLAGQLKLMQAMFSSDKIKVFSEV